MERRSAETNAARSKIDLLISLALSTVLFFFVGAGLLSYWNIQTLEHNSEQVSRTHQVILGLEDLLSIMKDAETGQRGFLITGDEHYLDPYNAAVTGVQTRLDNLDFLTRDSSAENSRIPEMSKHISAKLAELKETIDLRRQSGFDAAREVVLTDRGKNEMDELRALITTTQDEEQDIRMRRIGEMGAAYHSAVISGFLTGILGVFLSIVIAFLLRRAAHSRQRQDWLRKGQVSLAEAVIGDPTKQALGEQILKRVAGYLNAPVAALFFKDGELFKRAATYGVPTDSAGVQSFMDGDGLLGQATKDRRSFVINEIPDGYLTVGSAFGKTTPKHLVICPAVTDGIVNAVLEIGFLETPNEAALELLGLLSEAIAIAVRSANYRAYLQNLLEETQRQSEELQAQGEELRVNNEELEEQGRTLKESQARLEQQQAELEQTNAQLEEQAQLLEVQRDNLARSNEAVRIKAQELEKSSQYKSDFLANMSHELRTPLNSSLILAKLLGDNPKKNLTEEQVKFARTIQSSGNDLLMLINDILDLSKIEAGHMEVRTESLPLERLGNQLSRTFAPLAGEKGLDLKIVVAPNCPQMIETDPQRLEQILKNLLSNSIKFTEKGGVTLTITRAPGNAVSFVVSDTGIGIAPENQNVIFEAFRQADGTINRKYGGTGLGLSISREMARLLAGTISLTSEIGRGTTFTLTLPEIYAAPSERKQPLIANGPTKLLHPADDQTSEMQHLRESTPHSIKRTSKSEDDRERLIPNGRIILVVEDDDSFSRILYDLAHEYKFQCLIANSVEEALFLTSEYLPSAVLLDVGLPDHSGLTVLDQLKRDRRTRHIPVHVISANDYMQTAFSMGAVGYMLKPVKRDQIEDVLSELEKRLTKEMKRVLVVEDNLVQRDSIMKLLAAQKVETIGVGTATECLEQLESGIFDCMVLDISLPDATGYSLLETLSEEDAYSFPPVIVYTGRDLSANEEQLLRRYSRAIIIKGAKSPERLLDEVTLFLHQVVADLPPEQQRILANVKSRDEMLQGRRILAVEDDVRNVYALTSIFEPLGVEVKIARNGREALDVLNTSMSSQSTAVDLVLMDVMMPEMDGLTATREIRKNKDWKKLPIIMLTAKAMKDDQERCLDAGANDYMAKPLDVEKLLSLVRVWMPR